MMPFPGGIEDHSNGTLLLSAAAAVYYLFILRGPASLRRTIVKTAAVALLAVLAWIEGGPALLLVALILSAVGDAFLAQESERFFLFGLGSFLLAHLAYVGLFAAAGSGLPILTDEPWRIILVAALLVFGFAMGRRLWPALGNELRVPVALYIVAILAMGIAAATMPIAWVVVGALLFVASDAILAVDRFLLAGDSEHRAWTAPAVWVLYYLAQLAIALGLIL